MELITIRTFDNYITANITLSKLQDCGIECFLKDEMTATIAPIFGNAIGGIKLIVKETDVEKATSLLQTMDAEYLSSIHCPKCGNVGLDYISIPGEETFVTSVLSFFKVGQSIPLEHVYHCNNCNWESKTLPTELIS